MNMTLLKKAFMLAAAIGLSQAHVLANNLEAKADIRFKGSSTLHDFEGTACSQPFTAVFEEAEEQGKIAVSAKTVLNVLEMTTNHRKRDKNMFKMFDAAHYARIEGELGKITLSETEATEAPLHLKICNEEHDVTATISRVERNGNQLSCTMSFPVSLQAFHLKGPSVMGIIRVDDMVYVECAITGKVSDTVAGS